MIAAKAAYARARGNLGEKAQAFLANQVTQIDDLRDLEVFRSYFEAVMAYAKGELAQGKGGR